LKINVLPVHNVYTEDIFLHTYWKTVFLMQRKEMTLFGKQITNENYFARVES